MVPSGLQNVGRNSALQLLFVPAAAASGISTAVVDAAAAGGVIASYVGRWG